MNTQQTQDLVSNCMLCEEHGLHALGQGKSLMLQCLNCGYMSNEQLNSKTENIFYKEIFFMMLIILNIYFFNTKYKRKKFNEQ